MSAVHVSAPTMPVELSEVSRQGIDAWLSKYPEDQKQSAIIPALRILQDENGGWLTNALVEAAADYLEMPRVAAYEVATFYSMFELHECGRHKISICTNISCMLMGAETVVEHVEKKLGIKLGETTPDGRISLHVEEECLAACNCGPMMMVDGNYHEFLTPDKLDEILDGLD
ncbi:MAG: NADH-quinone oxidoreductase subunit NuoE [Gammaproteobacteria bacterium]